ncbi:MAG: hypothetical protein AAGJ79_13710 [Verrucomicrobiota bacterium]
MNSNNPISSAIMVGGVVIFAMIIMMEVLIGHGNNLGTLARFIAIGSFILGMMSGRMGLIWLMVNFAYGDLLKRVMVIFGNVNILDVTYVLAISPLTLSGVVVHYFIAMIFNKVEGGRNTWIVFFVCGVATAGSAAYILLIQKMGAFASLKQLAHQSVYFMVPWVIYVAFPRGQGLREYLRLTVFLLVPVALYAIMQGIWGLNQFEIDYLMTGLSVEANYLKEGVTHAFSTMSNAKSMGIVMALACGLVLYLSRSTSDDGKVGFGRLTVILLIMLFLLADFYCMKRASWVVAVVVFVGFFSFGSKVRTGLLYGSTALVLGLLILFSGPILKNWDKVIAGAAKIFPMESQRAYQSFRVSTLSQRLVGFNNLITNPDMWSLFGISDETKEKSGKVSLATGRNFDKLSATFSHDALSTAIMDYGVIPVALMGYIGLRLLIGMHRLPFRAGSPARKKRFVVLCSCIFACILLLFVGSWPYPVPGFIFIIIAMTLLAAEEEKLIAKKAKEEAAREAGEGEPEGRPTLPPGGYRPVFGKQQLSPSAN